jgi:HlyD family secretion protein
MHDRKRILIPIILLILLAAVAAWYFTRPDANETNGAIQASGTVEATEIIISPEISGRVEEVLAEEGDRVAAGDLLLRLDDDLLQAQRQRAVTALESAQANVVTTQTGVEAARAALESAVAGQETARIQYMIAVQAAQKADSQARAGAWVKAAPGGFDQPGWYFQKSEEITAAQAELTAAQEGARQAEADLADAIQQAGGEDLQQAEARLAQARSAYQTAQTVLDRANAQFNQALRDAAQAGFDQAETELEAAQDAYSELLDDQASEDILNARATLAAAQERQTAAQDRLNALLTGEESLQVAAAAAGLQQAEAAVKVAQTSLAQAQARLEQASSAVKQAQAELELADAQIEKTKVFAPAGGVLLTRSVEPGEVVQAGAPLMRVGQLDHLKLTVYVPEDRYGQIMLDQPASVTVDSYPGETFFATVVHIADQAEFTPRNVQTAEGRRTTVFAVELALDNLEGKLKPGMPADVIFAQENP